jgi:hypothetical protein
MGHTKPSDLLDLAKELSEIRTLEGLKEKSPNVFYHKAMPFLHFHDKDGVRWADVKDIDGAWCRLDIDFAASARARSNFLKAVRSAHSSLLKVK